MNKEEILSKFKNENKKRDEMEKDVLINAGNFSAAIGLLVVALVNMVKTFYYDGEDDSLLAVYLIIMASKHLYSAIKLKHKGILALGICELAFALVALYIYFKNLGQSL